MPAPGVVVLAAVGLVLVLLAIAAYHGSTNVAPSDCAKSSVLIRRTAADAAAARSASSAGAPIDVGSLRRDAAQLTAVVQGEQASDIAFGNRVVAVSDAVGRLASDKRGPQTAVSRDAAAVEASARGLEAYCG